GGDGAARHPAARRGAARGGRRPPLTAPTPGCLPPLGSRGAPPVGAGSPAAIACVEPERKPMHYSRLAAAGIGLAVAGALVLTVTAPASAALLPPSSYPHEQSLAGGVLTVQVSNGTSKTASC